MKIVSLFPALAVSQWWSTISGLYSIASTNTNATFVFDVLIGPGFNGWGNYKQKFKIKDTRGVGYQYSKAPLNFKGEKPPKITINVNGETVYDEFAKCSKDTGSAETHFPRIFHKASPNCLFELYYKCFYYQKQATTIPYDTKRQSLDTVVEEETPESILKQLSSVILLPES